MEAQLYSDNLRNLCYNIKRFNYLETVAKYNQRVESDYVVTVNDLV